MLLHAYVDRIHFTFLPPCLQFKPLESLSKSILKVTAIFIFNLKKLRNWFMYLLKIMHLN